MQLLLLGVYAALCITCAWLAVQRGRSAVGIFVLSVAMTPIVGYAVVVALPDLLAEERRDRALADAIGKLLDKGPPGNLG